MRLYELLQAEQYILTDASASNAFIDRNTSHRVNNTGSLTLMRASDFDTYRMGVARFASWFSRPEVYTTPQVAEEMRHWKNKFNGLATKVKNERRLAERTGRSLTLLKENASSLHNATLAVKRAYASSNEAVGHPENILMYWALTGMVMAISEAEHSNKESSQWQEKAELWDNEMRRLILNQEYGNENELSKLTRADEALSAAAVYKSSQRESSAILTADGDIAEIVRDFAACMHGIAKQSRGGNKLSENLRMHPVNVYYALGVDRLELVLSTQDVTAREPSQPIQKILAEFNGRRNTDKGLMVA